MKAILLSAILLILGSCSSFNLDHCILNDNPESVTTTMIPLTTGNKWIYKETSGGETDNKEIMIGGLVDLWYDGPQGKTGLKGYQIIFNNIKAENYFYLKCSGGVAFVRTYPEDNRIIFEGRSIPEKPSKKYSDPLNSGIKWSGPVEIEVPAGKFTCWTASWIEKSFPQNRIKEYYSANTGLVKKEITTYIRKPVSTMELIKFIPADQN